MIKKLRNRFLILMTASFSIITISVCVIVYLLTYYQLQMENRERLEDDALLIIEIDEDGAIVEVTSDIDFDHSIYTELVTQSLETSSEQLHVDNRIWIYTIKDRDGLLALIEVKNEEEPNLFIETDKTTESVSFDLKEVLGDETTSNHQYLFFLDVTDSVKQLQTLMSTLIKIGSFMLLALTLASVYFANRSIKPVAVALEKQKQFIADASHELKTPLTIIKSNHLMYLENPTNPLWLEYMDFGFERMTHLINDLLTLAQLDDGRIKLHQERFDLGNLLHDILSSMEARATKKKIKVTALIDSNLIINQDLDKMTQVLIILLDNAIKYTNDQGWIEVSAFKKKRHLTIEIKNSGSGIAKEDLSQIFERFYRGDLVRNSEGNSYGLGLPIAKAIIEEAGGTIKATSVENEVTTFRITI